MLPNDPLVADLSPIQVDWIIWNLAEEAKKFKDAVGGRERGIATARDLAGIENMIEKPAQEEGENGRRAEAPGVPGAD